MSGASGAERAGAPAAPTATRGQAAVPAPASLHEAKRNRLLASLPDADWQGWLPLLERVQLPLGHVIYESGASLSHGYFPTSAIVSLQYVTESGATAQIAVVGNEGIVGISLFMGVARHRAGRWCRAPARPTGCAARRSTRALRARRR